MGMGSEIQLQLQTKHNGIIFATHFSTPSRAVISEPARLDTDDRFG